MTVNREFLFFTDSSQSWSKCNWSVPVRRPDGGLEGAGCTLAGCHLPWSLTWPSLPWVPHTPRSSVLGAVLLGCPSLGPDGCHGHGVWLLGVGVRLREVCFDLVGIAAQTLGVFSEGCSLEPVLSFPPLLASSVALPCAATCPLDGGLSLLALSSVPEPA